jgi:translation initiation factor IF-1
MSDNVISCEGTVLSTCRDFYRCSVELAGREMEVLARLGRRLWYYEIRIVPGDRVAVDISAYDTKKGRIVRRLDPGRPPAHQVRRNT